MAAFPELSWTWGKRTFTLSGAPCALEKKWHGCWAWQLIKLVEKSVVSVAPLKKTYAGGCCHYSISRAHA